MKLLSIDDFPPEKNWNIDNFWSDKEKIELGLKKEDTTMTLNEFQIYLDELVNDIENYKEAIECLKQ